MPGGGTWIPVSRLTIRKIVLSHGFRSGAPQTATTKRPPTRRISVAARAGSGTEHETVPAEHDVEAAVRLVDRLEVEHAGLHVAEAAGAFRRGRDHPGRDVGDDDRAGLLRGGDSEAARPGGELEHAVAGLQRGQLEHALGERRRAPVDEVGVGAPRPRDRLPHPGGVAANLFEWRGMHGAHNTPPILNSPTVK